MTDISVSHVTKITMTIGKRSVTITEEEACSLIAALQAAIAKPTAAVEHARPFVPPGSDPLRAPKTKYGPLAEDDKKFIRKAHAEGASSDKIAGILGRSVTMVERELVELMA